MGRDRGYSNKRSMGRLRQNSISKDVRNFSQKRYFPRYRKVGEEKEGIFTCPQGGIGCHLPLYKDTHGVFIGAKNVNEAKAYMMKYLEDRCRKSGSKMVDYFGAIKIEGTNDIFYVSEMTRTDVRKKAEKRFEMIGRDMIFNEDKKND